MTQHEMKEQVIEYTENNLYSDTILYAICELLDKISNELYENGYTTSSNELTTALLKIKEVLGHEEL